jgi:hypothetical protein
MSTKNLARTVIESGRARWNKYERGRARASERAWERVTSQRLLTATEFEDVVYRPRKKVYRGQRDKLAPAERWLRSQIGRPWSKIRSELFARFDVRTTEGRHLLFDHVLKAIHQNTPVFRGRVNFSIDAYGILRGEPTRRRLFPKRGT